jgi:Transcription factor WhiB
VSYTGQTPDTEPNPDWRKSAACRQEDPDLFFPKGYEGPWQLVIEQAKAVCRRCPVVDACLDFADAIGATDGIFGGLTEKERASVRRAATRHALPPEAVAARTEAARKRQLPARERTLHTIFEDNTVRLCDGHLGWKGGEKVSFEGRSYTPKQVAFTADRGRQPDGNVRTTCGITECILPMHLDDQRERGTLAMQPRKLGRPRAECGTPSAYARHIRNGEVADEACKRAHAARSAQYRATGSTKASV